MAQVAYAWVVTLANRTSMPMAERVPFLPLPFAVQWLLIALGCGLATWLRFAVSDVLGAGFPFITFLPVVILATFLFGARAGLVAFLLTAAIAWVWFIPPFGSLEVTPSGGLALAFYTLTNAGIIGSFYWLQQANRSLVVEREANIRLAETRELLFRELQHRVSNNLQMIAALLTVQRRQIADEGAKAALDEASRRLGVIGRISRQLYDPHGAGQQLEPFLDQLARDIIETSGRPDIAHHIQAASSAQLSPEASIPLALVVAEAISNSIEHGFDAEQHNCSLTIRLRSEGEQHLAVEVEDNGRGLPEGFNLSKSDSLGLRIATMLADQLGGTFALQPAAGGGTVARLELPLTA